MNRLARVALAVALITVLPSMLSARPQVPGATLNYRMVFDLDRTHGNFLLAALQPQSYASLVTAALFGRDVPLPLELSAPVVAVRTPDVRIADVAPVEAVPARFAGMLVRMHSSRMQVQYTYDADSAVSTPQSRDLVSNALTDFAPSFSTATVPQTSAPVSSLRTNSPGSYAQSYSFTTPSELATPAEYAPFVS